MNKTKLPSLIPILILTLVTIIMWVSFDVYRTFKQPAESSVPANIALPLTPTLDQDAIKQIESRTYLDDSQIPDNIINSSPLPVINPTPIPTEIPVAEPTTEPLEASGSGITQ